MTAEATGRDGESAQRLAALVAAIAALVLLGYGLSAERPGALRWPLAVAVVIVGLGLAVGRLAQIAGSRPVHRCAQPVAAVAALVFLIEGLSTQHFLSPRWPLAAAGAALGAGLLVGPIAEFGRGRPGQRSVQPLAAVVAIVVLVDGLSAEHPGALRWPPAIAAGLLGAGLIVGRIAQLADRQTVHRSAQTVAAVAALVFLIDGLATQHYLSPRWPLGVAAVVLGLGLFAGPLAQLARRPREEVLSERVDELSRTRRGALDMQATELRRIERDLHDGAQVRLVALSMRLGRAEDRYRDDAEIATVLRLAREDATAAIRELRELARGIAPPVLADRGLEAAVRSLAERSGSDVTVSGELERRPMPAVETAAYFVVAESLTNAAKYAAGERVEVHLDERGGDLFVEVTDFGPGGAQPSGSGLTGLRQRVEALDGVLHVTSPAGVGTQVEAVLPCGR